LREDSGRRRKEKRLNSGSKLEYSAPLWSYNITARLGLQRRKELAEKERSKDLVKEGGVYRIDECWIRRKSSTRG